MKVLFITNYPSPYRVDFWNMLGKRLDLTVVFTSKPEEQKHRSAKWFNTDYSDFKAVFLTNKKSVGHLCCYIDIIQILKTNYDCIIVGGYSEPTFMLAIEYLKLHKIPFIMEADGGLIKNDAFIQRLIKRHFISSASWWFSSGKPTSDYFLHYGARPDRIYLYPFTSQWQSDVDRALRLSKCDKKTVRHNLGMKEENIVISVGRFSYQNGYGKGYDTLCRAAEIIEKDVGFYIIGDEPTEEFVQWKKSKNIENVHFVGFKEKDALAEYYAAADIFVLLTRNDVWGLVINEAMSFGLPIITTDMCGAGLSLIENDINGFIVPHGDHKEVVQRIKELLSNHDLMAMMRSENMYKISQYTIETMTDKHVDLLTKCVSAEI